MGRFDIINPLDMVVPNQLNRFLLNITIEKIAGRIGKEGGSFNWKGEEKKGQPDATKEEESKKSILKKWELAVPTHGNFAGPGYSCGHRAEYSETAIRNCKVAKVTDPATGYKRGDYVDILAQEHDTAYSKANGKPDYWELVMKADGELITGLTKLRDGTSDYYAKKGGVMTEAEAAYARSMLDGFKLKQVMVNAPMTLLEKLDNAGYGKKEINDLLNTMTQGIQFFSPREFLRKLNLSENEIQDIEQKYAAYWDDNGLDGEAVMKAETAGPQKDTVQTASASNQYQDEYEDEDEDYYYGPGMG